MKKKNGKNIVMNTVSVGHKPIINSSKKGTFKAGVKGQVLR